MKILYLYTFLLITLCGYSQNLVPNPSFEDTVNCPSTLADLSATTFWNNPACGSPDFFHSCNSGSAGVPLNISGNQAAEDGAAYIGVSVYDTQSTYSYREYVQAQLTQTLNAGQKYWVCFYVSLADTSEYAIKEIGAYFSDTLINYSADTLNCSMDTTLVFAPQVEFTDSIITERNGWVKVSGSFVASGGENYILLGNFNRSQTTTAIQVNGSGGGYCPCAYYYIDNICVSNDSTLCYNPTGIINESSNSFFQVSPNPCSEYFTITRTRINEPYDLIIYDSMGQKLIEEKYVSSDLKEVSTILIDRGIFFVNIQTRNQNIYYKLIKS